MNTKVVVYDAMCGQGKTERIIKEIAEKSHPVLYISPLLSEVDRVCGYLFDDDGKRMKDDDGNDFVEKVVKELEKLGKKYGFSRTLKPNGNGVESPMVGWSKEFGVDVDKYSDQDEVNAAVEPYLNKAKITVVDDYDESLS